MHGSWKLKKNKEKCCRNSLWHIYHIWKVLTMTVVLILRQYSEVYVNKRLQTSRFLQMSFLWKRFCAFWQMQTKILMRKWPIWSQNKIILWRWFIYILAWNKYKFVFQELFAKMFDNGYIVSHNECVNNISTWFDSKDEENSLLENVIEK